MPKKVYKKKVKSKINTVRRKRRFSVNRTIQPSIKRVILPPSSPIASLATSLGKKFKYVDHRMKTFNKQMNAHPKQMSLNSMISDERLANYFQDVGSIPYGLQQRMNSVLNPNETIEGRPIPGPSNQIKKEPVPHRLPPPPPPPYSPPEVPPPPPPPFSEDDAQNMQLAVLSSRPNVSPLGTNLEYNPRLQQLLQPYGLPVKLDPSKLSLFNGQRLNNENALVVAKPHASESESDANSSANVVVEEYDMAEDGTDAVKPARKFYIKPEQLRKFYNWVDKHARKGENLDSLQSKVYKPLCKEFPKDVSMLFDGGANRAVNIFLGIQQEDPAPPVSELNISGQAQRNRKRREEFEEVEYPGERIRKQPNRFR